MFKCSYTNNGYDKQEFRGAQFGLKCEVKEEESAYTTQVMRCKSTGRHAPAYLEVGVMFEVSGRTE